MDFIEQDLSGARFLRSDLSNAVLRGVFVGGMEIDSFDLHEDSLWVNGVDVAPYVEEELNRRFPGRGLRFAATPEELRAAWAAVEEAWAEVVPTAAGREEVSVDGEWSFAQTLRHLVMATNVWLHKAVLGREDPFHPLGLPNTEYESDGGDMSVFREPRSYDEVLAVRADHQAMVRGFVASVSSETLEEPRHNPWAPDHEETVRKCLQVILNEEWEHLRYAVRDLALVPAT